MSWRNGSAFATLGAANTAITVTTTTPIAAGERVILAVWRQQAATGTAAGNPTVSTLGGNAFSTLTIDQMSAGASSQFYSGLSVHSFIAPGAIGSGATLTVTPGNANQKVAAMLLVQGDPHPTQAPYAAIVRGADALSAYGLNVWQATPYNNMTWDKRLLVSIVCEVAGGATTPWVTVTALSNTPLNGFTEALDATTLSYGFAINVREQGSTDFELPSDIAGQGTGGSYGGTSTMAAYLNLVRAGAVLASLGPDVNEYNDFPFENLPGAASRPLAGQIWPR